MDYGCNRDNCKKGIHCKFAEIVFKLFNPSMHEYDYWDMAFKRQFQQYICYLVLYLNIAI